MSGIDDAAEVSMTPSGRRLSGVKPTLAQHLRIISGLQSFQAAVTQQIASSTVTDLARARAVALSSILWSRCRRNLRLYPRLRFSMIPASQGCSLEVVLGGRNTIFTL